MRKPSTKAFSFLPSRLSAGSFFNFLLFPAPGTTYRLPEQPLISSQLSQRADAIFFSTIVRGRARRDSLRRFSRFCSGGVPAPSDAAFHLAPTLASYTDAG